MSNQRLKPSLLFRQLLLSTTLGLFTCSSVFAEDNASEACKNAASLFDEGDIDGALEEARWCVTQLEQMKQSQEATFFRDEIAGYKADKLNQQTTMGFAVINRRYNKGEKTIDVTLSGGASNTVNSAFSALAQFGLNATPGKRVRIQKRSATLTDENGSRKVLVTLKSGGMLTFESRNVSKDEVMAFAKAFPVADLDNSRN